MTLIQTIKFIIKVQETGKITEGLQLLKSLAIAIEDGKTCNYFPAYKGDNESLIRAAKIQAEQNNLK
jgi:hypothetical protein